MSDLKIRQYLNSSNIRSRFFLHYKYSNNRNPWFFWIFDNIEKLECAKVLEIGCGNGLLWKVNMDRIPSGWDITLTDFSEGMLKDAAAVIGETERRIGYRVMEAENIDFPDDSFDIVFANNMLYHVKDKKRVLSEIRRVLKKDGIFYATTMDKFYMKDITDIIREFYNLAPENVYRETLIDTFSLQNGGEILGEFFGDVKLKIYENTLEITEAEPFVDYIVSLKGISPNVEKYIEPVKSRFTDFISQKLFNEGNLKVPADSGIFISIKTE